MTRFKVNSMSLPDNSYPGPSGVVYHVTKGVWFEVTNDADIAYFQSKITPKDPNWEEEKGVIEKAVTAAEEAVEKIRKRR